MIKENIARIKNEIGENVTLLAVSKTVSVDRMLEAVDCGQTLFGENYVQELLEKYEKLHEKGAKFHFIGHLQTNKVKYIIDKVELIQSVDSKRLAAEISRQAEKKGLVSDILIEVNIGREKSKSGVLPEDFFDLFEKIRLLPNIKIKGVMAIPPFDISEEELVSCFKEVKQLYIDILSKKTHNDDICILSMGMSEDYLPAIENGANLIRVGSAIFGERIYKK